MNKLSHPVFTFVLIPLLRILNSIDLLDQLTKRTGCTLETRFNLLPVGFSVEVTWSKIDLVACFDLVMRVPFHRKGLVVEYLFLVIVVHHHRWCHRLTRFLIYS